MWVAEKFQSNSDIAGSLRNSFMNFVQDEEHAILLSSHITSDLEKAADYVTFLHEGKVLFSKSKDELIYQYGILRCGKELFETLEPSEILAWRKKDYAYDVLVADRAAVQRKYRDAVVDAATVDEIMVLYVKGECVS